MSATGEEAVALLKSIDQSLKLLVGLMKVAKPKEIAGDSDLDSQYGDPIVNAKDPRDWTGPTQKGKRFSQCSSEYLELLASRLDFFADIAEKEGKTTAAGKPVAPYNRRDAARARGWAKRVREGWEPTNGAQSSSAASFGDSESAFAGAPTDDDIPF